MRRVKFKPLPPLRRDDCDIFHHEAEYSASLRFFDETSFIYDKVSIVLPDGGVARPRRAESFPFVWKGLGELVIPAGGREIMKVRISRALDYANRETGIL